MELVACPKCKWTNQQLEKAIDIIDRGVTSMIEANKHWNIPLSSFVDHLNGKTKSKKHVLMEEEDFIVVA